MNNPKIKLRKHSIHYSIKKNKTHTNKFNQKSADLYTKTENIIEFLKDLNKRNGKKSMFCFAFSKMHKVNLKFIWKLHRTQKIK